METPNTLVLDSKPEIDTPSSNTSVTPKPSELITSYVKMVVDESRRYMRLIDTAKTATKKQFYMKKLKANNQILAKLLPLQERQTARELAPTAVISPNETPVDTLAEVVDNS
jgi:hypothetical protein